VAGCLRPAKARGFCDAHFNRLRKGGLKPELPVRSLERKQPVQRKKPATTQ
jgi:hypothetical protein